MAHPHSAGWSSGDWHRPIINLPFHWCPLDFFLLLFIYFLFFYFFLISVLLIFNLFFFFFLSFFLSFLSFFILYYFIPTFFFCLTLCLSFSTLYHLSMHFLVMSIDTNFVFDFIAWVMVIILVQSTCQKWIHVRAWVALRVVHESTTFKGMRESVCCLASQASSLSS